MYTCTCSYNIRRITKTMLTHVHVLLTHNCINITNNYYFYMTQLNTHTIVRSSFRKFAEGKTGCTGLLCCAYWQPNSKRGAK